MHSASITAPTRIGRCTFTTSDRQTGERIAIVDDVTGALDQPLLEPGLPQLVTPDLDLVALTEQHEFLGEARELAEHRRQQHTPAAVDVEVGCMADQQP